MDVLPVRAVLPAVAQARVQEERALDAAVRLEANFLSAMLEAAGFGRQISTFSGGSGEDQFASFHRDALADRIARAGGIGLAEHFFQAMMEAEHDSNDTP